MQGLISIWKIFEMDSRLKLRTVIIHDVLGPAELLSLRTKNCTDGITVASGILVWKIPAAVMMRVKIDEVPPPSKFSSDTQHCSKLVTTYSQLIFNATGTAVIGAQN